MVMSRSEESQLLHVLLGYEGALDLPHIEQLLLQRRYADLPDPIRMTRACIVPYTMQLFIIPRADGKLNIVKHIRFEGGTKVLDSTILAMNQGGPLEIDFHRHWWEGSQALQHMIEKLGEAQIRYYCLEPNARKKLTKERQRLESGFSHIGSKGPRYDYNNALVECAEIEVADSPWRIYGWSVALLKESLRKHQASAQVAKTIEDYPLILKKALQPGS